MGLCLCMYNTAANLLQGKASNLKLSQDGCCLLLKLSQLLNFSTFQSFIFFGSLIQYDLTFSKPIDVVPDKSLSRFVSKLFKYLLFFWTILSFTSSLPGASQCGGLLSYNEWLSHSHIWICCELWQGNSLGVCVVGLIRVGWVELVWLELVE